MDAVAVSLIIAACIFAGGLAGLSLHRILPNRHLTKETLDVVRLAIGMISVLASLVLGLLIATAKSSFDNTDTALRNYGADLIVLHEILRDYGAAAGAPQAILRGYTIRIMNDNWPPSGRPQFTSQEDRAAGDMVERMRESIRALTPVDAGQTTLKGEALNLTTSLLRQRSLLIDQRTPNVRPAVLVVLAVWITLIFLGFGLNVPRNPVVVVTFAVCSLAIGGAILLVMEMDTPFSGVMRVSDHSISTALEHMHP